MNYLSHATLPLTPPLKAAFQPKLTAQNLPLKQAALFNSQDTFELHFGRKSFPENHLVVLDTTLRDGLRQPGTWISFEEKLKIATMLKDAGVDVIEAGFAGNSQDGNELIKRVVESIGKGKDAPVISAFARSSEKKTIDDAWEAVKEATYPRIHITSPSTDFHFRYQFADLSPENNLSFLADAISLAKNKMSDLGKNPEKVDIEYSPQDVMRADKDYLVKLYDTAIKAGATTVNVPDTVGIAYPDEYGDLVKHLIKHVKGADTVTWSVHTHNDIGLAVANTLAGIKNGAQQVEVTINGIGERAGNSGLEEVLAVVDSFSEDIRRDALPERLRNLKTSVKLDKIYELSQTISKMTGSHLSPNKPIVGENAFKHESGIYRDGFRTREKLYYFLDPKHYGREFKFTLSPNSSQEDVLSTAVRLGYIPPAVTDSDTYTEKLDDLYRTFVKFSTRIADNPDFDRTVSDMHMEIILESAGWKKGKASEES